MHTRRAGRAFSLTEILIVTAVLLILISILIVGVDALYVHAQQLKCQHRLEQIWQACQMYASGSHGLLPAAWNFDYGQPWYETLLRENYIDTEVALGCPCSDLASIRGTGEHSSAIPSETKESIEKALDWLAANQGADGSWGHVDGSRVAAFDAYVGTTGLALLAFTGYGCTTTVPAEYAPAVKKALVYLINRVGSGGTPGRVTKHAYVDYHQGCVTMALSEALALMGDIKPAGANKSLRQAAQQAFDYLVSKHATRAHGSFEEQPGVPDDMSASSWGYQGLATARTAGLVPSSTSWSAIDARSNVFFNRTICISRRRCDAAHTFYRSEMVDGKCPVCGSSNITVIADDYHTPYRFDASGGPHPNHSNDRMTASNLVTRIMMGHKPTQNHSPRKYTQGENSYNQMAWIRSSNKHISYAIRTSTSNYDLYFIYYTTLSFWLAGGSYWEEWNQGNESGFGGFIPYLIALQMADGAFDGPQAFCMYNEIGGRAYPTSLGLICLEASASEFLYGTKWSTAGEHSYGYNKLVGETRQTPASDTIVLMDYMRSGIDAADPHQYTAARHGGKANILFGDGRVEARRPEDITEERDEDIKIRMRLLTPAAD